MGHGGNSCLESEAAPSRESRFFRNRQDIKIRYRTAEAVPKNRVVFNIKGNTYRLVVHIHYNRGIVFIRFIGTHAEYDRIDVSTI